MTSKTPNGNQGEQKSKGEMSWNSHHFLVNKETIDNIFLMYNDKNLKSIIMEKETNE